MLGDIALIVVAVGILWKCADWFVEGAVGIAEKMHVPQMLVGMVLVSIATTSPELMTSLMAALRGMPDTALGNAVGSVVVDASIALGLAAVVSATPLLADPNIFRSSAIVLIIAIILAFLFAMDLTLERWEGAVLVLIYVSYATLSYWQVRTARAGQTAKQQAETEELKEIEEHLATMSTSKILGLFVVGFIGVLGGSHLLLMGAEGVALALGMSNVVMGLTVTAIGTSTPEIATCVSSALKRQSGIGVGNIIGADVLNICWVAGLSAVANPLSAAQTDIYFMFPAMFVIVLAMLFMLRRNYELTRWNGALLLALAVAFYAVLFVVVVPLSGPPPGMVH